MIKQISGYTGQVQAMDGSQVKGFYVNVYDGINQIDTLNFTGNTYDIGGNDLDDQYTYTFIGTTGQGASRTYSAAEIANGATIILPPFLELNSTASKTWYALAGGLGLILMLNEIKKKKKRVGKIETSEILPIILIGAALIGFNLIQKLLTSLGIWSSPETKNLDAIASSGANTNFWNPNYYLQFSSYPNGNVTTPQAIDYINQITSAFGIFNDCEECVTGVFRQMKTKSNVSFLAKVFYDQTGQDLLTYLRGGLWPQDRLSDQDVNTI